MKFYLSISLLLLVALSYSQEWQVTDIPSNNSGQRYDDVFFINENIGWAANGFFSKVYKTTDGGKTWIEKIDGDQLGEDLYFRNIEFLDSSIGFLGTLNGKFFKTIDGGDNWEEVINIDPIPSGICGLEAIGESTIYGCGIFSKPAFLIKSIDSGNTWTYKDLSDIATALVEVQFVDENLGYAGGSDQNGAIVLKTEDGGNSWSKIFNSGIAGEYVWKLQILNGEESRIFGAVSSVAPNLGKLIKSEDSGANWQSFDAPETQIQAVGFINENIGWMGGHTTGLYQTNDGGKNWTDLEVGNNLNRIFVISDNLAFAAGTSIYSFNEQSLGVEDHIASPAQSLAIILRSNPVGDVLKFEIQFKGADNIVIELYDINGKFIKQLLNDSVESFQTRRIFNFNVSELSSGSYFLNLHNNYNRKSIQFIKR